MFCGNPCFILREELSKTAGFPEKLFFPFFVTLFQRFVFLSVGGAVRFADDASEVGVMAAERSVDDVLMVGHPCQKRRES